MVPRSCISVNKRKTTARATRQNNQSSKQTKSVASAPLVVPRSICVAHFALFLLRKHWLGHYFHIPIFKRKKGIPSTSYNPLVGSMTCRFGNEYVNDKINATIRFYDWLIDWWIRIIVKHVRRAFQNIPSSHIAKQQTKITSFAVLITTWTEHFTSYFFSYIYLSRRGSTNILGCTVGEIITK